MFDNGALTHHIERYIIQVLMYHEFARFTDLRPPQTDSNLFSYHLKLLLKRQFVAKTAQGYTLSHKGMRYADRVSTQGMRLRTQPKIITMLFIQQADGSILLQKRSKQPYINTWTLPYGKLHIEDASLHEAARREANEKLAVNNPEEVRHIGDCYIRTMRGEHTESTTLAHVMQVKANEVTPSSNLTWAMITELSAMKLAPAVEAIVTRCNRGDNFFFEEFTSVES